MHGIEDGETGVDADVAAGALRDAILTELERKQWSADGGQEYHQAT